VGWRKVGTTHLFSKWAEQSAYTVKRGRV
jgi:hypothetical protein